LFHQRRDFSNVFTSVNEDRTAERPVLDQYDVPGAATGLSLNAFRTLGPEWDLIAGADLRLIEGEVNELYRNLGQGFTRDRSAGGEQSFAGAFANIRYRPMETLSLDAVIRVDQWRNHRGYRRETNLETGTILTDTAYDPSSGWEPTLGLSGTVALAGGWTTVLSLSHGFRVPTLNELYRPYRVVNDITEANPQLGPEISSGIEWTINYRSESPFHGQIGLFGYQLEGMVSNVFRSAGPGVSPICGFVPGGGSCSERENVESSQVLGGEIRLGVDLTRQLTLSAHAVFTDTEIEEAPETSQLTGKAFPQSPVIRGSIEADWQPTDATRAFLRYNYTGPQYDDALNTRELSAAHTIDLAINYRFPTSNWSIGLAINNLLDAEVEAALSSSGLVTLAEPRIARLSLRYEL
jgi:outer membrane receptor protein involved in Fe transport